MRLYPRFLSPKLLCLIVSSLIANPTVYGEDKPTLNYEYFRDHVQPVFLVKRQGNIACATCHAGGAFSGFNLEPLDDDKLFWTEAQSRKNFAAVSAFVVPGADPLKSRFLTHPLATAAGGDPFHGGGTHFDSQTDAEWQILARWVTGAKALARRDRKVVRIIQTNAAGDNIHLIDPETNSVAGVIEDIRIPHGVTTAPDGSAIFISNEFLKSVDFVDPQTLTITRRIPLSGEPNNLTVTPDGKTIYVGIMEMPGSVDIIDVASKSNVKTLPVQGAIHNIYVTPDGKYAVAGSIHTSTINVIDTRTNELAWTIKMDRGIRPMTFDTNPDGSTKNIYVQLSNFHGFAVVDFKSRKEIARVEHPAIDGVHPHYDGLQLAPTHGLAVSPDGKTLWSTSKVYGYAYVHSLPDLKEVARIFVGQHPEWLTFTPDGRYAYVAAAGDNQTFVIDAKTFKEVKRIDVGQVPKRNGTGILAVE